MTDAPRVDGTEAASEVTVDRFRNLKLALAGIAVVALSGYLLDAGAEYVFLEDEFARQIAGILGATALLSLVVLAMVGLIGAVLILTSR
jgi:hypothetical protein